MTLNTYMHTHGLMLKHLCLLNRLSFLPGRLIINLLAHYLHRSSFIVCAVFVTSFLL